MDSYTIERIDGANVIRISDEEMERRGLKVGDQVTAELERDAYFEEAMREADDLMGRYKDALAELAK